jgi:hypothetical protein
MQTDKEVAGAALDALNGARGRPANEAATELRGYLNSIKSSADPHHPHAEDVAKALEKLVNELEINGSASDDDWQGAIEAMLTFANETI